MTYRHEVCERFCGHPDSDARLFPDASQYPGCLSWPCAGLFEKQGSGEITCDCLKPVSTQLTHVGWCFESLNMSFTE